MVGHACQSPCLGIPLSASWAIHKPCRVSKATCSSWRQNRSGSEFLLAWRNQYSAARPIILGRMFLQLHRLLGGPLGGPRVKPLAANYDFDRRVFKELLKSTRRGLYMQGFLWLLNSGDPLPFDLLARNPKDCETTKQ